MSELTNLKQELINLATSTDIGFNLTPEIKEKIESLAAEVEALNPTPEPTKHLDLVEGRWRLLYSTFGLEKETTLARLSFGKLPNVPISVNGIFQEVAAENHQYNNLIEFNTSSGLPGIVVVNARYSITDEKRLTIDFLATSVKSVNADLSDADFRAALGVEPDAVLESQLEFNGWSDVTYLDENLRLMRGNANNLYVLLREN
ncbi:MAG TPA: PAP/fibrillin family protein [Nostocaceae cyanobacterium]|nr:PAP/fibrillin family protein [Nostocaceae cyanobacterium]